MMPLLSLPLSSLKMSLESQQRRRPGLAWSPCLDSEWGGGRGEGAAAELPDPRAAAPWQPRQDATVWSVRPVRTGAGNRLELDFSGRMLSTNGACRRCPNLVEGKDQGISWSCGTACAGCSNRIPQAGCFMSNKNVFLIALEAGKSSVNTRADLVSPENRLPESCASSQGGRGRKALPGLL